MQGVGFQESVKQSGILPECAANGRKPEIKIALNLKSSNEKNPLFRYIWNHANHTVFTMKKLLSIALLPLVAVLLAAQPHDGPKGTPTTTLAADSATVYFYRGKQFSASLVNYVLLANDKEICRLSVKRYVMYKAVPGKVYFTSREGGLAIPKREQLELDLEAGKSYYVQCDVKTGLITTRMEMTEVTESTAKKKMDGLQPDNCMTKAN